MFEYVGRHDAFIAPSGHTHTHKHTRTHAHTQTHLSCAGGIQLSIILKRKDTCRPARYRALARTILLVTTTHPPLDHTIVQSRIIFEGLKLICIPRADKCRKRLLLASSLAPNTVIQASILLHELAGRGDIPRSGCACWCMTVHLFMCTESSEGACEMMDMFARCVCTEWRVSVQEKRIRQCW
jgi:hypothetical protein